jgi:hypothetical protein
MNFRMKKVYLLLAALLAPSISHAAVTLTNVSAQDFDKIVSEFSANSMFTTVSGASSLGKIAGFELGLVAGMTRTPEIERIVTTASPGTKDVDKFPHGSIVGMVTVPWGLTIEGSIFPKYSAKDVSYQQAGGGLRWTFSDFIFDEPMLDLALRGFYSTSKITTSQLNSGVRVNLDFKDTIWGGQLFASKKISFFEPYVGVGFARGNGDVTINGSVTSGILSFTSSNTAESKPKAAIYTAGANIQVFFLVLGAEYQRVFGKSGYTGKISFRF